MNEFYFVRHAETIWTPEQIASGDTNIPITELGRLQAETIRTTVHALPVQTVCHSPLLRAQQTAELITAGKDLRFVTIKNLEECSFEVWDDMLKIENDHNYQPIEGVDTFFKQSLRGLFQALEYPGPVLIVAHGGIFWSLCYQLKISTDLKVDHCRPVHFFRDGERWQITFVPVTEEREKIGRTHREFPTTYT